MDFKHKINYHIKLGKNVVKFRQVKSVNCHTSQWRIWKATFWTRAAPLFFIFGSRISQAERGYLSLISSAPPPPPPPSSLDPPMIFIQFLGNFGRIIGWRRPLWSYLPLSNTLYWIRRCIMILKFRLWKHVDRVFKKRGIDRSKQVMFELTIKGGCGV